MTTLQQHASAWHRVGESAHRLAQDFAEDGRHDAEKHWRRQYQFCRMVAEAYWDEASEEAKKEKER